MHKLESAYDRYEAMIIESETTGMMDDHLSWEEDMYETAIRKSKMAKMAYKTAVKKIRILIDEYLEAQNT